MTVVGFSEAGTVGVLHFHRGKSWDIGNSGGHFYKGWELDDGLAATENRTGKPPDSGGAQ